MLKHLHPEFPSDLYVPFEAVNAKIIIRSTTEDFVVSPKEFLAMDMTKVGSDVSVKKLGKMERFSVLKILRACLK